MENMFNWKDRLIQSLRTEKQKPVFFIVAAVAKACEETL